MITIESNQIIIQNYKKILSVYNHEIHIIIKNKRWIIYGEKLMIIFLNKDDVQIHGDIHKVEIINE